MRRSFTVKECDRDQPIRVAQYLRVSTDHQRYSMENQAQVIAEFASENDMTIVKSYQDQGKSGLDIEGREGLCCLLHDV
jgi:DNA invertase Pin-like site-specific DNA recombinase